MSDQTPAPGGSGEPHETDSPDVPKPANWHPPVRKPDTEAAPDTGLPAPDSTEPTPQDNWHPPAPEPRNWHPPVRKPVTEDAANWHPPAPEPGGAAADEQSAGA